MTVDFNQQIIEEFRANQGRVGGPFEGSRLLLLTTTGARTGKPHTTPLGYLPDGGPRKIIIASAGGAPNHPAWYHNLLAHPRVSVEDGTFTFRADAVVLEGEQRDRVFARATEADPGWGEYQASTDRVLPVIALDPVDGAPNASSWGDALKAIHDAFRNELTVIRREIAESGAGLGAQLRINCLTVCQGLEYHHAGEEDQLFPFVENNHPELASTVARLRDQHAEIARLVTELQTLVSSGRPPHTGLLAEVDRLTGELDAHLTYEEEQLIPTLNAVSAVS